jgi:hypothetical protein
MEYFDCLLYKQAIETKAIADKLKGKLNRMKRAKKNSNFIGNARYSRRLLRNKLENTRRA